MPATGDSIRLTVAQAIIRYLTAQHIKIDGVETRICGGGFGIFGHGNMPCPGEALYQVRDDLPMYRGQHEQGIGFAAADAKYHLRRRFMFCTACAGPGIANLLTAAALAQSNCLPMLLCSDTFMTRLPDPVLQQLEHFGNPALGLNAAFRAVCRYSDRITDPAQVLQTLTEALATLLDPADCGPAFLGQPQAVQGWAWDYPAAFFATRVHRIRRQSRDLAGISKVASLLRRAKRPVIMAGGGVQYSGAVTELTAFAQAHDIPVVETIAQRANMLATHPLNIGPIGVIRSDSAITIAGAADVVLAVGKRLQDFPTGLWTVFGSDTRLTGLNVGRHDAAKYQSLPVVGDAKPGLGALGKALGSYGAPGILIAEVTANWRTLGISTVDVGSGFSCMGHEISGHRGARIAQSQVDPEQDTIVFVGDGSYLLLNSDIYSSVLTGKKLIVLALDNGGFAVINKLQNNTRQDTFNNLIADCPTVPAPVHFDLEGHARSIGAKAADKTSVIMMRVDPCDGRTTQGHAWWEISTAAVSAVAGARDKHVEMQTGRVIQRQGI